MSAPQPFKPKLYLLSGWNSSIPEGGADQPSW